MGVGARVRWQLARSGNLANHCGEKERAKWPLKDGCESLSLLSLLSSLSSLSSLAFSHFFFLHFPLGVSVNDIFN